MVQEERKTMTRPSPIPARFYRTENGREPVREWLQALGRPASRIIGETLLQVQFGWPVGMPICRSLGNGLYETRADLPDGRTARVFFTFGDDEIVMLHAFIKKTQKTPDADLRLARERLEKDKRERQA